MVCVLRTCCLCCDVRTGANVIGILTMISCLYHIATLCLAQAVIQHGFPVSSELEEMLLVLEEHSWLIVTCIVVRLFELIVTIIMVAGSLMSKRKLIAPWLIAESVITVLAFVLMIAYGVDYSAQGHGDMALACFLGGVISLVLSNYYILVGYSHYKNLSVADDSSDYALVESEESVLSRDSL